MSRILNSAFVWIGSATHDTSDAFRQRQRERIRRAQNNGVGAEIAARKCAQANPIATLAEDGSRRGPPGQCKSDPTPPIRRMQNTTQIGPLATDAHRLSPDNARPGKSAPFNDAAAALSHRPSDGNQTSVAASPHSPFARKEGK